MGHLSRDHLSLFVYLTQIKTTVDYLSLETVNIVLPYPATAYVPAAGMAVGIAYRDTAPAAAAAYCAAA